MITRIHVNGHRIKSNRNHDRWQPVITAKSSGSNQYGYRVDILDKDRNVIASVIQSRKPLSCGALVWVETECDIRVHSEEIL
jgi:hypothetical protein